MKLLSKFSAGGKGASVNMVRRVLRLIRNTLYRAQLEYLKFAAQSAAPGADQQMRLLKPTSDRIQAIQALREKNRASAYFNHLSAISESIPALGWVTVVSELCNRSRIL